MNFGAKGVMASVAVGKFLLIILAAVMIILRTGSLKNIMMLPENFGGSDEDNVYTSITSEFDVIAESRLAELFCGAQRRLARKYVRNKNCNEAC